ncbi:MAG: ECF transporter S component [Clostridia bacterium]|nr:ECF transporter S component [Clostridia bacterium]
MTVIRKLTYAGLFLALAVLLPMLFHLAGFAGQVFLPMHIPVLLCGFICGKRYGLLVGAVAPLINTMITGMPVLYPIGIAMVFELAAYGFFSGFFYEKIKKVIPALLGAMIVGRIIRIAATYLITIPFGAAFIFKGILTALFVTSIWGILIQLILIPIIMAIYKRLSSQG